MGRPTFPSPKGHNSPIFGPCLLWPNDRPSQLLLSTCFSYSRKMAPLTSGMLLERIPNTVNITESSVRPFDHHVRGEDLACVPPGWGTDDVQSANIWVHSAWRKAYDSMLSVVTHRRHGNTPSWSATEEEGKHKDHPAEHPTNGGCSPFRETIQTPI